MYCPETESTDWFPDNGVDDTALAIFGDHVYATLDDIGETYSEQHKVWGLGLIKEGNVTELVKAWADGKSSTFGIRMPLTILYRTPLEIGILLI